MKNKKYDFRTAYIDLLINVLTGMVFLFMISTLLIQINQKVEDGVKKDAQYIVVMTWPTDIDCDVDMWVRAPDKTIVNFMVKDMPIMHLERDDLGWKNDTPGSANEEIWTLRGKLSGEYTVNIHLYSCRSNNIPMPVGTHLTFTLPVTVKLIQINPTVVDLLKKTIILDKIWQEKTAFNFTLKSDNSFDPNINLEYHNLVKIRK